MSQKSIDIKRLIKPPSDWKLVKLKDIVELKYGYRTSITRLPPKDGIQIIITAEIKNNGRLDLSKLRTVDILSHLIENYKIKKNDLLFNWRNAQEHIGKVAIVDFQPLKPMIYASFIIRIRTSEFVNYRFLHALLTYYRWIKIFFKLSGRAVNQANFNAKIISRSFRYISSINSGTTKIASILSNVDELIKKTEQIIEQTQRLKKGLMQRLLTKGIGHTKFKKTEVGEIPEEWDIVKLKDISSKFISGGTPSTSNSNYWNGEIPWIRSAWITKKYVSTGEKFITKQGLENSAAKIIPKENVIIATRVSIGNIAINKIDIAINKIDIAINQDLTGIVVDKSKVSSEYLYWILRKHNQRIEFLSQGSTIPGITREDIITITIPKPSLKEQQKIASILSKIDESIIFRK